MNLNSVTRNGGTDYEWHEKTRQFVEMGKSDVNGVLATDYRCNCVSKKGLVGTSQRLKSIKGSTTQKTTHWNQLIPVTVSQ
jgi:hypothetical protein